MMSFGCDLTFSCRPLFTFQWLSASNSVLVCLVQRASLTFESSCVISTSAQQEGLTSRSGHLGSCFHWSLPPEWNICFYLTSLSLEYQSNVNIWNWNQSTWIKPVTVFFFKSCFVLYSISCDYDLIHTEWHLLTPPPTNQILYLAGGWGGLDDEENGLLALHVPHKELQCTASEDHRGWRCSLLKFTFSLWCCFLPSCWHKSAAPNGGTDRQRF